ncbi:hypothetical protein PILCRDRAFT_5137 [Piloderma croceum F 1598]|uniref:CCHC-type domain-containing protein n=1 Tax=Piloderma croceum (strain F 1598) TaxID=765440 RepID=A0A0C3G2J1_PILCF|nr:hypothetical protein PILCRDRAFT_5137 [Piloderma croceum F 1598]
MLDRLIGVVGSEALEVLRGCLVMFADIVVAQPAVAFIPPSYHCLSISRASLSLPVPAEPVPSAQNPEPTVPTVCIHTLPPWINLYQAALDYHRINPQLRNERGRFTHCHTNSTIGLHPAVFTPEGSPTGTEDTLLNSSVPSSPSSVTFSEVPSPNKTPATSPAPQPPPVLLALVVRHHMLDHKGSLQWEGSMDDNLSPGQFLCEIENKSDERGHTTERLKINCLKNNIAFGSRADEWFTNLDATEKDTYDHLVTVFEKQWPLTAAPKTSKMERIQMLKDWVLKLDELGKKVEGPGRAQIWLHMKVPTQRRVQGTTHPVRDLIRTEPRRTYDKLSAAVLVLDTSNLKDRAAAYACDEETAHLACEPASPTKALRETFSSTHIQPPCIINQTSYPTAQNPFQTTGGQGNLFNTARCSIHPFCGSGPGALGMGRGTNQTGGTIVLQLWNRPAATHHQDLLNFALPQHPNTTEGLAAYQVQVTVWHAANPSRKPDKQHPYPLTLGTPPVGSRECWDCGQKGHMQSAPVCAGATLPEPERDWQRIVGFIACTFHAERLAASHAVNFISTQQYTPYPAYHQQSYPRAYIEDVEEDQGNGRGLSE